jgi:hypothetical protein
MFIYLCASQYETHINNFNTFDTYANQYKTDITTFIQTTKNNIIPMGIFFINLIFLTTFIIFIIIEKKASKNQIDISQSHQSNTVLDAFSTSTINLRKNQNKLQNIIKITTLVSSIITLILMILQLFSANKAARDNESLLLNECSNYYADYLTMINFCQDFLNQNRNNIINTNYSTTIENLKEYNEIFQRTANMNIGAIPKASKYNIVWAKLLQNELDSIQTLINNSSADQDFVANFNEILHSKYENLYDSILGNMQILTSIFSEIYNRIATLSERTKTSSGLDGVEKVFDTFNQAIKKISEISSDVKTFEDLFSTINSFQSLADIVTPQYLNFESFWNSVLVTYNLGSDFLNDIANILKVLTKDSINYKILPLFFQICAKVLKDLNYNPKIDYNPKILNKTPVENIKQFILFSNDTHTARLNNINTLCSSLGSTYNFNDLNTLLVNINNIFHIIGFTNKIKNLAEINQFITNSKDGFLLLLNKLSRINQEISKQQILGPEPLQYIYDTYNLFLNQLTEKTKEKIMDSQFLKNTLASMNDTFLNKMLYISYINEKIGKDANYAPSSQDVLNYLNYFHIKDFLLNNLNKYSILNGDQLSRWILNIYDSLNYIPANYKYCKFNSYNIKKADNTSFNGVLFAPGNYLINDYNEYLNLLDKNHSFVYDFLRFGCVEGCNLDLKFDKKVTPLRFNNLITEYNAFSNPYNTNNIINSTFFKNNLISYIKKKSINYIKLNFAFNEISSILNSNNITILESGISINSNNIKVIDAQNNISFISLNKFSNYASYENKCIDNFVDSHTDTTTGKLYHALSTALPMYSADLRAFWMFLSGCNQPAFNDDQNTVKFPLSSYLNKIIDLYKSLNS